MANTNIVTEFRVMGREYDGAADMLAKSFPKRMVNIVIQEAMKKHGENNVLIPTDVHIMPVYLEGDSFFAVRAWHETKSPKGQVGVIQPYLGNFDLVVGEQDGYLHHRPEVSDEDGTLRTYNG
jgi:hypothetical protein